MNTEFKVTDEEGVQCETGTAWRCSVITPDVTQEHPQILIICHFLFYIFEKLNF